MDENRKTPAPNGIGTLIFGIVFTVVGAGLLIEHFTGAHVWRYLWRLWPLLLIIMGAMLLILKKTGMRARYVFLALLIIAVGSIITASHRGVFAQFEPNVHNWTGSLYRIGAVIVGWRR